VSAMPVVEESLRIRAPADGLFALSQDYGLRLEWDPFLRDMTFLGGATEAAVGVRVRVRAKNGLAMEVEYVSVNPPHVVGMRMTRGPFFFRLFAGVWQFRPLPDGATEVTFRYSFETRWPWLRWLLDPVIRVVFRRDIRARLRGLKEGAERRGLLERLGQRC
jgi:ribosome-associated toxin RatA of RatAB toxin-antitoxin module